MGIEAACSGSSRALRVTKDRDHRQGGWPMGQGPPRPGCPEAVQDAVGRSFSGFEESVMSLSASGGWRGYCNNAVPADSGVAHGRQRGGGERWPDSGFLLKVRACLDCSWTARSVTERSHRGCLGVGLSIQRNGSTISKMKTNRRKVFLGREDMRVWPCNPVVLVAI